MPFYLWAARRQGIMRRLTLARDSATEAPDERYRPMAWAQIAIAAAIVGVLAGAFFTVGFGGGSLANYEYSLMRWQAETTPGALARLVGIDLRREHEASDEELLRRYFAYTTELRDELNRPDSDPERRDWLYRARDRYEVQVEHIVRGYVGEAVEHAGLQETLPFFSDVSVPWPPVEFRLANPPHVLVISPRDEILRMHVHLLRQDLTMEEIERLEQVMGQGNDVVAHIVAIGGMAAYPAMVRSDRNYWSVVETAAHEWVHHYLAFYPLGQQWGRSQEAITLNETVATIGGRALAEIVHEQYPMHFPDGMDGSWVTRPAREVDFHAEMQQLRRAVDELLAQGEIVEAETLMEATRLFLAEHGAVVRKIDQAYFAFHGAYAARPGAVDPIGPKVQRVWELTGNDVGLFLELMRDVRNVAELDELLRRLEALRA